MAPNEIWLDFEKPIAAVKKQIEDLKTLQESQEVDTSSEIKSLETKMQKLQEEIYGNLTPWQRIKLARHPNRPYTLDYVKAIFKDFIELHGDRRFSDDPAIVGGPAFFQNQPVMLIGQQKGRDTKENILRNFGMPHPEGYRKALRLMKMAEKFMMPIICFIDTPGAYPGIGAEERGQAEAIAYNLQEMESLEVPTLGIVIGEGGSGGALGIGVCNQIMMLENAYYSVISPEGAAAILWRDAAKAPEAAEALKITAHHLLELGVIDKVIAEPLGGAHQNLNVTANNMQEAITQFLNNFGKLPPEELIRQRYEKFRQMGQIKKI